MVAIDLGSISIDDPPSARLRVTRLRAGHGFIACRQREPPRRLRTTFRAANGTPNSSPIQLRTNLRTNLSKTGGI